MHLCKYGAEADCNLITFNEETGLCTLAFVPPERRMAIDSAGFDGVRKRICLKTGKTNEMAGKDISCNGFILLKTVGRGAFGKSGAPG